MDTLEHDRSIVESILIKYTEIPYSYGDFHTEAVFDRTRDRYVADERRLGRPRAGPLAAWSISTSSMASSGSSATASSTESSPICSRPAFPKNGS